MILYELLTGRLPFSGSGLAIAGQILTQAPLPPSTHRSDLDPALEAICLKAMAKTIGDRYASMAELAAALTGFLQSTSASPTPAAPAGSPASPSPASGERPQPAGSNSLVGQFLDQLAGTKASPSPVPTPEPVASTAPLTERRRTVWPMIVAAGVLGVIVALCHDIRGHRQGPHQDHSGSVSRPRSKSTAKRSASSRSARRSPSARTHDMDVKWGDGQFQTRKFVLRRGDNESLKVETSRTRKDEETASREKSPEAAPKPGARTEATTPPKEITDSIGITLKSYRPASSTWGRRTSRRNCF